VMLVERLPFLGGRAGAWTDTLADGTPFEMERGFHAFFRQYHNLRALLRRIDPDLAMLTPLEDYPILGPDGLRESLSGLPQRPPWNVAALTWRTPTLRWRDLLRVNGRAALEMVRFDPDRTYARFDGTSARDYLDSLAFPPVARRMLFDVFSHSFFNPESEMSAAELLMMFHFYFVGNPEGLIFDVVRRPFSTAIWQPFGRYLASIGVEVRTNTTACAIERSDAGGPWRVATSAGTLDADLLVLALDVPGLQALVARAPALGDAAWRARIASLGVTRPFAVWRLWLDRPVADGRAPFAGTTGVGRLDNISLYHLFEDESRHWTARTGGAVVELHAYGVEPDATGEALRADLLAALHHFYPETAGARVLEDRFLLRQDCASFAIGSHASRPGVRTPDARLAVAGDFVRLPVPSALMERAVTSGMAAANILLEPYGAWPEPLRSIPVRGLLAGRGPAAGEVHW
jgi:carotenoid phi-ring synthase / carotenoid chi-ring synthase